MSLASCRSWDSRPQPRCGRNMSWKIAAAARMAIAHAKARNEVLWNRGNKHRHAAGEDTVRRISWKNGVVNLPA